VSRRARFDILAHDPYSVRGPFSHALNRYDVSVPDLYRLTRVLRRAHLHKRVWATEFSWDSRPPDPQGVPIDTQARWAEQSLYVLWRQGVDAAVWFQIRDQLPQPSYGATYQSGTYFNGGR